MRLNISLKIMALSILTSLVIIGVLSYQKISSSNEEIEEKFGVALKHIALTAARGIDGDMHDRIQSPADHVKPEFKTIRAHLEAVREANGLDIDTVYTFHPRSSSEMQFCVMLHKQTFIGDPYRVPKVNRDIFRTVLAGEGAHTGIYGDDHGAWISGLAPIKNSAGKVTGILEVDYRVDRFLAERDLSLRNHLLVSGTVLLIGVILSFAMARTLSRPIEKLNEAARALSHGYYTANVNVQTRDELEELAGAFNKMASRIEDHQNRLEAEMERSEELLLNILPASIAEQLKQNRGQIADGYASVSVLFADIVGFTKISESMPPNELVTLLNGIFSKFDALADIHKVEKIKTIGDSYMVAAGIPDPREDHAERLADMAMHMLDVVANNDYDLKIRIGINSGPVVAGVIGAKKFIYDLWGDTVNTASRLEAYGIPGEIQVSEETYILLKDKYELKKRGTLILKKKKEMFTTFILVGKKPPSPGDVAAAG